MRNISWFIILLLFTASCKTGTGQNKTKLSADEFENTLNATAGAVLLDVRTPEEYAEGHLKGAKNLNVQEDVFAMGIGALDKNKPVFVYCLAGSRSAAAAKQMRDAGFKTVYELDGGIMKWRAAGKPEEKGSGAPKNDAISMADFDQKLKDNAVVLVDFSATWCAPCRMMKPTIDSMDEHNNGKFAVVKIDADKNRDLAQKYNIMNLPTVLIFKNGKQVWLGEGLMTGAMLTDAMNKN